MQWRILSFLLIMAVAGNPAAADFSDGLEAYDAGRYGDALDQWRALAAEGHLDSMAAIAGLYASGAGVQRDYGAAAEWYRRAADCGHAVAQLNLGELYERGRGVARDLVAADVYLSRSAAQGNAWAQDRLAAVRAAMSADQKKAAAARLAAKAPACSADGP